MIRGHAFSFLEERAFTPVRRASERESIALYKNVDAGIALKVDARPERWWGREQ